MTVLPVEHSRSYHRFRFHFENTSSGEIKIYACSDVHFDNAKCDRALFKRHLDYAVKNDARIVIHGDLLCLMQGKFDRRSSKSALLSEDLNSNYIDSVINNCVDFLTPYADRILIISKGNHETAVSDRIEIDILQLLVDRLNRKAGSNVQMGGYAGYYTIQFNFGKARKATHIAYAHGHWGGVISKGTQSVARYGLIYPQADIILSGHTHDSWIVIQPRHVLNPNNNTVKIENQYHIKTGTYKEEFLKGEGWAVEKIGMPKTLGGAMFTINASTKADTSISAQLLT